ncbi:putative DNA-directed RNA polymerase III RPC4 [Seiridium cardinale]|uniref:DNA-directed RNA polymerase III RPC4 n=1 Tax=Seiridium cardinale TaxID=138064 RepID=A0ABR2X609_9PEZI
MSSRGSTRGGRGARSARGGRGASATAAVPSTRPSIEGGRDGDAAPTNAPTSAAAQAITIESSLSATNSPAATPAPSARGGRFKPKAVRRDATERQKLEDQRNQDLAAKIKVEEREQRDADRRARRGGRGRGRGDAGFIRRTVTGGGVFSGIGQDMVRQGGGSWASYGRSGVKAEGNSQYGPRYHDRRVNDLRVNVDTLRDSATPEVGLATGSKSPGVLPMGIIRVEHKQEEVKVATSAELEAEEQEDDDDDELFVGAQARILQQHIQMADDNEVWNEGSRQPEDGNVEVKPEPGTEGDDVMDIDDIPVKPKPPPSPELQKKPLAQALEMDAKAKARERKRERVLQDPEVQSAALDAATMLDALTLKDGDGQGKDNQLFLFQFPPILPPLLHLDADGSEVVDLEDGGAAPTSTNSALPPKGGYIGRLNVRKSGKIELDWGGRILDLGIATETDYLTTAIIVDEQENESLGKATGMGNVYGKFVATPVFREEDDWNPDLDTLGLSV